MRGTRQRELPAARGAPPPGALQGSRRAEAVAVVPAVETSPGVRNWPRLEVHEAHVEVHALAHQGAALLCEEEEFGSAPTRRRRLRTTTSKLKARRAATHFSARENVFTSPWRTGSRPLPLSGRPRKRPLHLHQAKFRLEGGEFHFHGQRVAGYNGAAPLDVVHAGEEEISFPSVIGL